MKKETFLMKRKKNLSNGEFQKVFSNIKYKLKYSSVRRSFEKKESCKTLNFNQFKNLKNLKNLKKLHLEKKINFKTNHEILEKLKKLAKNLVPNEILNQKRNEETVTIFFEFFKKIFCEIPYFQNIIKIFEEYIYVPFSEKIVFKTTSKLTSSSFRLSYKDAYNNLQNISSEIKLRYHKIKNLSSKKIFKLKEDLEKLKKENFNKNQIIEKLTILNSTKRKENFDLARESLKKNFEFIELNKKMESNITEINNILRTKEFEENQIKELTQNLEKNKNKAYIRKNKILLLIKRQKEILDTNKELKNKYFKFQQPFINLKKKLCKIKELLINPKDFKEIKNDDFFKKKGNDLINFDENEIFTKKSELYFDEIENSIFKKKNTNKDKENNTFSDYMNLNKEISKILQKSKIFSFSQETKEFLEKIFDLILKE